jgi:hypothetical protein
MKKIIIITITMIFLSGPVFAQMGNTMKGNGQQEMVGSTQMGLMANSDTMMMPMRDMMPILKMMKEMMQMQKAMMQGMNLENRQDNSTKLSGMMEKLDGMMTDMKSKTQTKSSQT